MKAKRAKAAIEPLGAVIDSLTNTLGIKSRLQEYEAVVQWEGIVGERIARMTTASRIVKGILFVKVKTSTWRNELNVRKKEIIEKINRGIGGEVVKDIKFQ